MVDRSAFDRIIQAGGFVSVNTGTRARRQRDPDPQDRRPIGRWTPPPCIGCGACVAQCPNGAAQLFTSAKISHLALLPQGQPER